MLHIQRVTSCCCTVNPIEAGLYPFAKFNKSLGERSQNQCWMRFHADAWLNRSTQTCLENSYGTSWRRERSWTLTHRSWRISSLSLASPSNTVISRLYWSSDQENKLITIHDLRAANASLMHHHRSTWACLLDEAHKAVCSSEQSMALLCNWRRNWLRRFVTYE